MTWGRTDITGTTVYNFGSNITGALILDRTAPYIPVTDETLTVINFYGRDNTTPAFNVGFALYDITSGLVNATLVWSEFFVLPIAGAAQWNAFNVTTPPTLTAGRSYARAFTRGQSGQNADSHRIAAATNFGGIYTKPSEGSFPSPSGTATAAHNFDYLLEYVTVAEGPAFDLPNTDETGSPGQTLSASFESLGARTVSTIKLKHTASSTEATQSFSVVDADTVSYTLNRGNCPYGTLVLEAVLSDATVLTTAFTMTVEAGFQVVTLVDPLASEEYQLVNQYTGDPVSAGMQLYSPLLSTEGGTIDLNIDGSATITFPGAPPAEDSINAYLWDETQWRAFTATFTTSNESGAVFKGMLRFGIGIGIGIY